MMGIASLAKPRVVIGSDGVDHVLIHIVMFGQVQAPFYDFIGMTALMGRIEMVVAGEDFLLDVCYDSGIYHPPPPALTVVTIELTLTVVLCPPE